MSPCSILLHWCFKSQKRCRSGAPYNGACLCPQLSLPTAPVYHYTLDMVKLGLQMVVRDVATGSPLFQSNLKTGQPIPLRGLLPISTHHRNLGEYTSVFVLDAQVSRFIPVWISLFSTFVVLLHSWLFDSCLIIVCKSTTLCLWHSLSLLLGYRSFTRHFFKSKLWPVLWTQSYAKLAGTTRRRDRWGRSEDMVFRAWNGPDVQVFLSFIGDHYYLQLWCIIRFGK